MPIKAVFSGGAAGEREPRLGIYESSVDIVYTSSGSASLVIALAACKLTSLRRKVIIPAYTCPSVLAAVESAGLQAVLCDLAPHRFSLDENQLAKLLDENTLAVVYVHLYGLDRRAYAVKHLAKKAGAWFIEDAAQAFGNQAAGKYLGSDGDLTILSFGRGKPLSAIHGGAVVVNSPDLADPIDRVMQSRATPLPVWFGLYYRLLLAAYKILFNPRFFAMPQALPWFRIGETVYIDRIPVHRMAGPGMRVLNQLLVRREAIQHTRSKSAVQYLAQLMIYKNAFAFIPDADDIVTGPLRFPLIFKNSQHKTECLKILTEMRLGASGSYPSALTAQPGVPGYIAAQGPFPNAEAVAAGVLTLPTHEYVQEQDINVMARVIGNVVGKDSFIH